MVQKVHKRFTLMRSAAVAAIAAVVLSSGLPTSSASAAETPPAYLVPWEGGVPAELSSPAPVPAEFRSEGNADIRILEQLTQALFEHPELGVAGTEWDAEAEVTLLYATADSSEVLKVLEQYGLVGVVEPRHAAYSAKEMSEQIQNLVGESGVLPSGQTVIMAVPELDGSGINLTIDEADAWSRSGLALPEVGPEVRVEYGEPAVPALRNHAPSPPANQRYSGAYMNGGGSGCTTGFRGARVSDMRPSMLSADHCQVAPNTGPEWHYGGGTTYDLGVEQGTIVPPTGRPDIAVWSGTGIYEMVPGILLGTHLLSGVTLQPIKGAVTTSVGSNVCYSGAFSGTVCGNLITAVGATVCYGAPYGCYDNLTLTTNTSGTPAAGSGDSGGPVYITQSTGVHATGYISGVRNHSTACTGEPGVNGRVCSPEVIFASVVDSFYAGYGISYIP